MIEGERRKPCHILRFQSIAFDSKLLQSRFHVDRVPESEDVDYKSQCAELVLLSLSITLQPSSTREVCKGPRQDVRCLRRDDLAAADSRCLSRFSVLMESSRIWKVRCPKAVVIS